MFDLEPHLRVAFFPKCLHCLLTFMPSAGDGPGSLTVLLLLENNSTFWSETHPAGVERHYHYYGHTTIVPQPTMRKQGKKIRNKKKS